MTELDLTPYQWEPFPIPEVDARLIERKDARVSGRVYVSGYTRRAK